MADQVSQMSSVPLAPVPEVDQQLFLERALSAFGATDRKQGCCDDLGMLRGGFVALSSNDRPGIAAVVRTIAPLVKGSVHCKSVSYLAGSCWSSAYCGCGSAAPGGCPCFMCPFTPPFEYRCDLLS